MFRAPGSGFDVGSRRAFSLAAAKLFCIAEMGWQIHALMKDADELDRIRHVPEEQDMRADERLAITGANAFRGHTALCAPAKCADRVLNHAHIALGLRRAPLVERIVPDAVEVLDGRG